MSARQSAILLTLALALGAYVWFFERGELPGEVGEALFAFAPEEAVALEVPVGEARARIEREGDAWKLRDPLAFDADAGTVERLLETLAGLESTLEIEPLPSDLEPFGLAGESGALEVFTRDAPQTPVGLRIGGRTPLPGSRYVRVLGRDDALFAVSSSDVDPLEVDLFELREKRIVRTSKGDVTALRILADGVPVLRLERRVGDSGEAAWWISEPLEDRADEARVDRLLQDLVLARASRFIDEFAEGDAYGLRAPRVGVALETLEGEEHVDLGEADEKVFARVAGRDVIFETAGRLLDSVPTGVFAFREKQVLELDAAAVERIALEFPRDGTSYAFERRAGRFTSSDESVSVDANRLDDLAFAVSDLEATGVEDETDREVLGLATPRVRVTLHGADSELGWLELGDPDPELGLAARSSLGERLWRVPNELGRDVPLGEDAFANQFREQPEEDAAEAEGGSGDASPSE